MQLSSQFLGNKLNFCSGNGANFDAHLDQVSVWIGKWGRLFKEGPFQRVLLSEDNGDPGDSSAPHECGRIHCFRSVGD